MFIEKIKAKLRTIGSRIDYWIACHFAGYCPTTREVANSAIKELAKRLNGESDRETLTNILEWEDANINFWDERHPISGIVLASLLVFPIILAVSFVIGLMVLAAYRIRLLDIMFLVNSKAHPPEQKLTWTQRVRFPSWHLAIKCLLKLTSFHFQDDF